MTTLSNISICRYNSILKIYITHRRCYKNQRILKRKTSNLHELYYKKRNEEEKKRKVNIMACRYILFFGGYIDDFIHLYKSEEYRYKEKRSNSFIYIYMYISFNFKIISSPT